MANTKPSLEKLIQSYIASPEANKSHELEKAIIAVLELCSYCDKATEEFGCDYSPTTMAIRRLIANELGIDT